MMGKWYNRETVMDGKYQVISEWKRKNVIMVTVKTPGGCSVMEKSEWCRIFGRLHPELWKDGKRIKGKSKIVA